MNHWALLLLALACDCAARALVSNDIDAGALSCEEIRRQLDDVAGTSRRCQRDEDCALVGSTACFYFAINASCAAVVDQSGAERLRPLLDLWTQSGCAAWSECPCPEPRRLPGCWTELQVCH